MPQYLLSLSFRQTGWDREYRVSVVLCMWVACCVYLVLLGPEINHSLSSSIIFKLVSSSCRRNRGLQSSSACALLPSTGIFVYWLCSREWVAKCLGQMTDSNRTEAQAELRQVIADAFAAHTLWTTDWEGVQLKRLSPYPWSATSCSCSAQPAPKTFAKLHQCLEAQTVSPLFPNCSTIL